MLATWRSTVRTLEHEGRGDLLVGAAPGHQAQDLQLPRGEPRRARLRGDTRAGSHAPQRVVRRPGLARGGLVLTQRAQRLGQVAAGLGRLEAPAGPREEVDRILVRAPGGLP